MEGEALSPIKTPCLSVGQSQGREEGVGGREVEHPFGGGGGVGVENGRGDNI
jgi:hypothetical protein